MNRPAAIFLLCSLTTPWAWAAPRQGTPTVGLQTRGLISLTNPSRNDTLYPVSVNNWWGYMNKRGNLIVFPRFDWVDDFYDGLARAVSDGKTGFIKGNGDWVLAAQYPYADRFSEGRAVVGDGEHFGFIDKTGRPVVLAQLDGALRYREGMAGVMKGGQCGFVNTAGDLDIPMRFASVRSFHNGFAAVRLPSPPGTPGRYGYIDRRGRLVYEDRTGQVAELGDFHEGLARIKVEGKWGYLGRSFKVRIEPRFDQARDFTQGLAAIRIAGRWGYIDKTGRSMTAQTFDSADDFDDTLAMVGLAGRVGYINRVGDRGIEPQFGSARPFFRGYARVDHGPSFGYITVSGSVVWNPEAALLGFINNRSTERAAVAQGRYVTHNRTVAPPPMREPIPEPYPPDHLYDEVLPPRDQ
jgi:WG repeat protein